MNFKQAIAGLTLAGLIAGLVPAAPALADGRASTRNIFLGLGAATYLIIQHNRKVHQRYAEDARRQAYAEQQANDAQAAYASERTAYENEAAANSELRQEVAYQHNVILKQDRELAMAPVRRGSHRVVPIHFTRIARDAFHASRGYGRLRLGSVVIAPLAPYSYGGRSASRVFAESDEHCG
jgi:hypothetical protein